MVNSSMKKMYYPAITETIRIKPMGVMIPASDPEEPQLAPIP